MSINWDKPVRVVRYGDSHVGERVGRAPFGDTPNAVEFRVDGDDWLVFCDSAGRVADHSQYRVENVPEEPKDRLALVRAHDSKWSLIARHMTETEASAIVAMLGADRAVIVKVPA